MNLISQLMIIYNCGMLTTYCFLAVFAAEMSRKRKLLAVQDEEDAFNTRIRRQQVESEAEQKDIMFQRNETLFKLKVKEREAQFRSDQSEKLDAHEDSRMAMRMKLKNTLQETKLDNAHDRSFAFISERSSTAMAMTGLVAPSYATFSTASSSSSSSSSSRIPYNGSSARAEASATGNERAGGEARSAAFATTGYENDDAEDDDIDAVDDNHFST